MACVKGYFAQQKSINQFIMTVLRLCSIYDPLSGSTFIHINFNINNHISTFVELIN